MEESKEYQQFVEKIKSGHVYTWGGRFTADTVLATALINQVCDKESIELPEVHRIFDKDEAATLDRDNIVYGIGFPGNEFDYRGEERATQTAFGKIYNVVGEPLHGDFASTFAKEFVEPMDECVLQKESGLYNDMINLMNPNWDDRFSTQEAFNNAVRLAEQTVNMRLECIQTGQGIGPNDFMGSIEHEIYEESVKRVETSASAAEEMVVDAAENSYFPIQGKDGTIYKVLQFSSNIVPSARDISTILEDTGYDFTGYTVPTVEGGIIYKTLDHDGTQELEYPKDWLEGHCPNGVFLDDRTGSMYCDSMETWENSFAMMVDNHDFMKLSHLQENGNEEFYDEEDAEIA